MRPPWRPGQSGNPTGRVVTEAMKLCRQLTPEAVETLHKCLKHKSGQVQVMAAKAILEHAWGRPAVIDGDGDGNALPDLIRDLIVSRVEMVIVRPEDRDADGGPSRGQADTGNG